MEALKPPALIVSSHFRLFASIKVVLHRKPPAFGSNHPRASICGRQKPPPPPPLESRSVIGSLALPLRFSKQLTQLNLAQAQMPPFNRSLARLESIYPICQIALSAIQCHCVYVCAFRGSHVSACNTSQLPAAQKSQASGSGWHTQRKQVALRTLLSVCAATSN